MKTPPSVYLLKKIFDDPRYEGFGTCYRKLPDVVPPMSHRLRRDWRIPSLKDIWIPLKVVGRVRAFNDYPCVNGGPAFSARAVFHLRDLLEPNGELLPLRSTVGKYFHFNLRTVANILNVSRSVISWNPKPIHASKIEYFAFKSSKLAKLPIFRIPQQLSSIFVTDQFRDRCINAGLRGMEFQKVWPLAPGEIWWYLAKLEKWKSDEKEFPKGQSIKGQAVRIELDLHGKSSTPTESERRRISLFMDRLDELLVDATDRCPPVGNLEGHDYCDSGKCRLFLSCRNAKALVEKLMPLLRRTKWHSDIVLRTRRQEYYNEGPWGPKITIVP